MGPKFTDERVRSLNREGQFIDSGMGAALLNALEPDETAKAAYSVSAHIWVQAVLTDRALLLVKGAVRAKVVRVPLPLEVLREPRRTQSGVRVRTPLGNKTLWQSNLDPNMHLLLRAARHKESTAEKPASANARQHGPGKTLPELVKAAESSGPVRSSKSLADDPRRRRTRKEKAEARRLAGRKPRKPRRQRARKRWVGFAPPSQMWDMANNCVKCGRPLTDPRSRQARVGTKCIKVYGSQQRKIPNPAYGVWLDRKTKADVDRIAEQATYDAQYARATEDYARALENWNRIRAGNDVIQD